MGWNLSGLIPGDNGITSTVNAIRQAVYYSLRNFPQVRAQAELITMGLPERDELAEANSVYDWVVRHYRFLKDPRGIEMVKSPEISLKEIAQYGMFQGDCDDVSALLAALLAAIGYKTMLVVISVPGKGAEYRHIFPRVYLPKRGVWLTLEATCRKKPLGWEAPNGRAREYPLY